MPDNNQPLISPVTQALQVLFGRSQRQMDVIRGVDQNQPQPAGRHTSIEEALTNVFNGYSDVAMDRVSKYRDYDRMDSESSEIQTALDIYAEEASQNDAKFGRKIWVESEDPEVENLLNGMFDRIKLEQKAYGIYRNIAKHGDCFVYLVLGGYGIHDTIFIHPSRLERVQDDGLLGFKSNELATIIGLENKNGLFPPWNFVHFRCMAYDKESVYGRSFVESLRKIWKQLSMLECYDDQTEILTKSGWKLFKDLVSTDEVATRNPDTKEFEWQLPTEIVNRPHDGDMISLQGKSIDLLVTPNHRVLLDKLPSGDIEGPVENYANGEVVIRAEELLNNSSGVSMPKMSGWSNGVEIEKKVFPNIPNNVSSVRNGIEMNFITKGSHERTINGDDFCALMGMYLSEGCVSNKKNVKGNSGGIRIAQQKESKGYLAYKETLKRINNGVDVPYDGHTFYLNWKALNPYFEQFGLAADKFIPDEILGTTTRQLKIFFDFFVLGDGYYEKEVVKEGVFNGERRISITTISKKLAEQLVEIIQKLGYGVSLKIVPEKNTQFKGRNHVSKCKKAYTIRVLYSKNNFFKAERVQYKGNVYCVHVPNHFVYVRRNNKMVWGSNTMVVLYRIAKSVQRNIFYVDVGQASAAESTQLIKQYEQFLKNKTSFVDPVTKEFRLDFNPATLLQDIVWPIRGGPSGTQSRVEYLQNTNQMGPLEDLEYFRNKIRSGVGIPKDYFDGEPSGAWNAREALLLQDARFAKKIAKLQDAMRDGVVRLCQIYWAITKGAFLEDSQFTVYIGDISESSERNREEVLIRKGQILALLSTIPDALDLNKHAWADYLFDQIWALPKKLRDSLYKLDPEIIDAAKAQLAAAKVLQAGVEDDNIDLEMLDRVEVRKKPGPKKSPATRKGEGSSFAPGGKMASLESLTDTEINGLQEEIEAIKERLPRTNGNSDTTWKKRVKWSQLYEMARPPEETE